MLGVSVRRLLRGLKEPGGRWEVRSVQTQATPSLAQLRKSVGTAQRLSTLSKSRPVAAACSSLAPWAAAGLCARKRPHQPANTGLSRLPLPLTRALIFCLTFPKQIYQNLLEYFFAPKLTQTQMHLNLKQNLKYSPVSMVFSPTCRGSDLNVRSVLGIFVELVDLRAPLFLTAEALFLCLYLRSSLLKLHDYYRLSC